MNCLPTQNCPVVTLTSQQVCDYDHVKDARKLCIYPQRGAVDSKTNILYFTSHWDKHIRKLNLKTKKISPLNETYEWKDRKIPSYDFINLAIVLDERNGFLYVSTIDYGFIKKINLKTNKVTILCTLEKWCALLPSKKLENPHFAALALDHVNQHLYFADKSNMAIGRISLKYPHQFPKIEVICGGRYGEKDGSLHEAEFHNPSCLAWDSTHNLLYVGQETLPNIRVINLETRTVSSLFFAKNDAKKTPILKRICDLEIDVASRHLYAVGNSDKIMRVDLTNPMQAPTLLLTERENEQTSSNKSAIRGIIRNLQNGNLYITDYYSHAIRKVEFSHSKDEVKGCTSQN